MTTTRGKKSRAPEKIKIFIVAHVNFYAPFYLTLARMQADKNSDIKQVDFVLSGTDEKVIYNIYKEEKDDNTLCIALCEPIFERKNGEENLHIKVDDERITFKDLKDDLDHYPFVNRLPMWGIADLELLRNHNLIAFDNLYRFRQLFQSSSNISLAEIKQNLGLLKDKTSLHVYTYPEGSTLNKESKRLFDFTQKNVTLHAEEVRDVFKPIEQNKRDQPWIVFTVEPLAGFERNSHNKNIGLVYASAPRLTTATSIICHKEAREKWGGRVKTLLDTIELVTADFYDSINFSDKFSKQSFGILYEYIENNGWTYSSSIPQKDIDPKDKLEFSIYQNDRIYTFDIKKEAEKWQKVFKGIATEIQNQAKQDNQSEIFRDKEYNPKDLRDDENFIDKIAIGQESKISDDGPLKNTAFFVLGVLSRLHKAQQLASKKSAIAAIISRNMSHNLGSHVINYLKNTVDLMGKALCSGAKVEKKRIFNFDATQLDIDDISIEELKNNCVWMSIEDGSKVPHSFLETSLYAFLEYINRRMEFIATLTTSVPSTPVTINLKKEIWDIIDKEKNYLLEFIAKSEIGSKPELEFEAKGLDIDNLQVAIPDGVVGAQGFYTIVENFIRNSAKHGFSESSQRQLKIKVDLSTEDNDFYEVKLSNNFGDGEELLKYYSKQGNELYKEKCDNGFIINPRFIDNTGTLVHNAWGIKEMFIGACYLRGLTTKEYNQTGHERPILKVGIDDNCNVIYTFYLFKPKPLAVVAKEDCKEYANFKDNFVRDGVDQFLFDDLAGGNQFIRHDFCLLHECFSQNNERTARVPGTERVKVKDGSHNVIWIDKHENFLPYRIFCDCNNTHADRSWAKWDTSWNNETCFLKFYQKFYKKWIETFYKCKGKDFPCLIILNYPETSQLKKKLTNAEDIALLSSNDKGDVAGLINNDSLKHAVIFCDHLRKNQKKYIDIKNKLECKGIKTSWEEISSSNSTSRIVGDLGKDVHGIGKYQLIEACLARVVIIDERIYNNCEQNLYDFNWDWREIRVFNYDQGKGQFISKHNGNTVPLKNETANPDNPLNLNFIRQNGKKVDFFVIHRGIIEKILDKDKSMETAAFLKSLTNVAKHIVIVSGRGKPTYIDDSWYVRFTNLENLYHWFFDCKVSLVRGLFSLINRKGD